MTPFIFGFRALSSSRSSSTGLLHISLIAYSGFTRLPFSFPFLQSVFHSSPLIPQFVGFSADYKKSVANMPSFILLQYCFIVYVNFLSYYHRRICFSKQKKEWTPSSLREAIMMQYPFTAHLI